MQVYNQAKNNCMKSYINSIPSMLNKHKQTYVFTCADASKFLEARQTTSRLFSPLRLSLSW